jgi:hypothetical protein
MASINRTMTINDIPEGPGKTVLLKILNTPKVDLEKLHRISQKCEKSILREWEIESSKTGK